MGFDHRQPDRQDEKADGEETRPFLEDIGRLGTERLGHHSGSKSSTQSILFGPLHHY